jgi:hypothetical protein
MMKLKVGHVFEAMFVLTRIINENRPLPQKGAYRVARLHAKLMPEFQTISARRDALITAYDYRAMVPGPQSKDDPLGQNMVPASQNSVPPDKMEEFQAAWKDLAAEEIEVDVEAVPLAQLDLGDSVAGCIQTSELITLGDLVAG